MSMNKNKQNAFFFIGLIGSYNVYADFTSYDISIYGSETSFESPQTPYDDYIKYAEYPELNTNFWFHRYYNFEPGHEHDECVYHYKDCDKNPHTHSGIDFPLSNGITENYSFGFGKILERNDSSFGQVTIRHLVNSGEYFNVNLLHSSQFDSNISESKYIVKNQYIGKKDNIGVNDPHLHLEISDSVTLSAPVTDRAHPGMNDTNPSAFTKADLVAHYDSNNTDIRYYNPYDFVAKKKELIPFLSWESNSPSETSYNVYGIAKKQINGNLAFNTNSTSISRVGILAKRTISRENADNPGNIANPAFLAESEINFNGLSGNSESYIEGDYLFLAYIEDNNENRYGYPILFSFVAEGGFIIDNDKQTYSAGHYYIEDISTDTRINQVPGYFLTGKLIKVDNRNNNSIERPNDVDTINWQLSEYWIFDQTTPENSTVNRFSNQFQINAYIPEGATATSVNYFIQGNEKTYTKNINQFSNAGNWVSLGIYELNQNSFVKVTSDGITQGQWLAADAIKFEKINVCSQSSSNTKRSTSDSKNTELFLDLIAYTYPELLSDGSETFQISGYDARYFQLNDLYLGVKNNQVYTYSNMELQEYGSINSVIEQLICNSVPSSIASSAEVSICSSIDGSVGETRSLVAISPYRDTSVSEPVTNLVECSRPTNIPGAD